MEQRNIETTCRRCEGELTPFRFSSGAQGYLCTDCGATFREGQLKKRAVLSAADWRQRDIIIEPDTLDNVKKFWANTIFGDEDPGQSIKPLPDKDSSSFNKRAHIRNPKTLEKVLKLPEYRIGDNTSGGVPVDQNPAMKISKNIGVGGMGEVYLAHQHSLNRDIAIKRIKPEMSQDLQCVDMFITEAIATGILDHPNIVPVYDLGVDENGQIFYAMKYVRGTSWSRLLNPYTPEERALSKEYDIRDHLDILLKVCDAVAFAHSKGIIHRDLKPDNVMVGSFGEVIVLDWGLAVSVGNVSSSSAQKISSAIQANRPCGTPNYLPPEMAVGDAEKIGPESDVYLLGAILFYILYKRPPHAGKDVWNILQNAAQNILDFPDTVSKDRIPFIQVFENTLMTALDDDPECRFEVAGDFAIELRKDLKHFDSIAVANDAGGQFSELKNAIDTEARGAFSKKQYTKFAEIIAMYKQALASWPGNAVAKKQLVEVHRYYARVAIKNEDLSLARSEIDAAEALSVSEKKRSLRTTRRHSKITKGDDALQCLLEEAYRNQEKKKRNLRFMQIAIAGLLIVIMATFIVSYLKINTEKEKSKHMMEKANYAKNETQEILRSTKQRMVELGKRYDSLADKYNALKIKADSAP